MVTVNKDMNETQQGIIQDRINNATLNGKHEVAMAIAELNEALLAAESMSSPYECYWRDRALNAEAQLGNVD